MKKFYQLSKKKIAFLAFSLFLCISMLSRAEEVKWKIDLSETTVGQAKSIQRMPSGVIVVSSDNGACGIDPFNEKILWKSDAKVTSIQPIYGTDMVRIDAKTITSSRLILLNNVTGKVVFDSKDEGLRTEQTFNLSQYGLFLFEATNTQTKRKELYCIDLRSESIKWKQDVGEGKNAAFAAVGSVVSVGTSPSRYMILDGKSNIVFIDGAMIKYLDINTGNITWTLKTKLEDITTFFNENMDVLYFSSAKSDKLDAVDLAKGTSLFGKKPLSLSGKYAQTMPYEKDKIFVATVSGFNILNMQTNTFEWKKFASIGTSSAVSVLDKGFLVMGKNPGKTTFTFVDKTGKKLWSKGLTGDFIAAEFCEKGLFYFTSAAANVMNLENKGADVIKKGLKFSSRPSYFMNKDAKIVTIYADKKLYSFNIEKAEFNLLVQKIKFSEYDEETESVIVHQLKDGFALSTNQNLWIISKDGAIVATNFYPPVGMSAAARQALKYATAVAGDLGSQYLMQSGLQDAFGGAFGGNEKQMNKGINKVKAGVMLQAYTPMALYAVDAATKSKSATASSDTHISFLTKFDSKEQGLLIADKETGKEVDRILLKGKNPVYLINSSDGFLLLSSENTLYCFGL